MADNNDTGNGVKPTLDPTLPPNKTQKPPIKPDGSGGSFPTPPDKK